MTNISKPHYLKLLFCCIAVFVFISSPIFAEEVKEPPSNLYNKPKAEEKPKAKSLKSINWETPEKAGGGDSDTQEDKEKTTDKQDEAEKELTADQKLWKKYKDLASNNNKAKEDAEDEPAEEEAGEETAKSEEETKEDEGAMGIRAIVESYKNSQKNKGKMSSRSFGKID